MDEYLTTILQRCGRATLFPSEPPCLAVKLGALCWLTGTRTRFIKITIPPTFCRALSAVLLPPCQVLELRGDSFQHFGNAAIVQSIVDKLPEIAREIAAPLAKTEKVRPRDPPPPCSLQGSAATSLFSRVIPS